MYSRMLHHKMKHYFGPLQRNKKYFNRLKFTRFYSNLNSDKKISLMKDLQSKIKFSGPITVHEFMKEVLTNPLCGYYMKKNVLGAEGDFITSPEISQMFGELIGIWMYSEWHKMGAPKPFQLIEFGPGTGTLMQDMLRTLRQLKLGKSDMEVHLIEKSLFLSNLQEQTLCQSSKHKIDEVPSDLTECYKSRATLDGVNVHWHYHLSDVPPGFSMVLAHEFFDCLPIHKLRRTEDGWREVLIDIEDAEDSESGLRYVLSRGHTPASKVFPDPEESRNEIEVSPEAGVLMRQLASRVEENGGGVIIVDYGHDGTVEDSFRAFRNHQQVSPLVDPGNSDLTSDVDFSYLRKQAMDKLLTYGPVSQGTFLKNMGIELRLQKLLQRCDSSQYKNITTGYKMLVDRQQMGERFKVMAFLPLVMKDFLLKYPPAGFYASLNGE